MGFGEAVSTCFTKYVTFGGRAARPEYWYWILFTVLVGIPLNIVDMVVFEHAFGVLNLLFELAIILPSLAVAVRRLHDTDRSGWWLLISFVPFFGAIVMIVFMCLRGTAGANRFGQPTP